MTQSALPPDVRSALLRYRILANIVGVLLIPLVVFAWPRHLLYDESSGIYQAGEWVNTYLGPLHGFFYLLFFFFTVLLSRRVRWSLPFTAVTVLLGTVPFVSFWAEHRATSRIRREQAVADRSGARRRRHRQREPLSMSSRTAFVLGGGGLLGAVEVGMLQALFERDIKPDLVLGTSVGALNGLVVASDPTTGAVDRLLDLWSSVGESNEVYSDRTWKQVRRAVRTGTHIHSAKPLRERLEQEFGDLTFDQLAVPFQCCAASIERAAEHWFTEGPVVPAVVASAAVPGLLPPARVGGEHYLDGGIVNSIPVGRAVELGADRVFVLQVGRVDRPLSAPRRPWEVARVSFEIARRHRFVREMAALPDGVVAHVLPAAGSARDDSPTAYRDTSQVAARIQAAYDASQTYLDEHL